jgi:hypothetical protein
MYVNLALEREQPANRRASFFGEAAPQGAVAPATCGRYETGEVLKSHNQGHLSPDVIPHARGLLLADYGVDWRTPPDSMKRERALKDWLDETVKVIAANPTTKIRILGFSDCVGKERHNQDLRRGRAIKTLALFQQLLGSGPAWNSLKAKTVVEAAPTGEYVASNDTVAGRAQNRGVLVQSQRTIDMKPTTVRGCVVRPSQAKVLPLMRLIPNVPFDRSKLPLNYRLDAKKVVGETAADISKHTHTAGIVLEAVHWGIVAAEIFASAGVLAIAAPLLAVAAGFFALGSGCAQAAEVVAKNWSTRGYARGIVIGANGKKISEVKERFGNDCCPRDNFCDSEKIAKANYLMGLFVGYLHGRMLCPNQREWFWRDLGQRAGDQSHLGPSAKWSDHDLTLWYASMAGTFQCAHLE